MKNTRFRLGACLIFASLTFQSYSQKSIRITPEIMKSILNENPMQFSVFRITKREIDYHTADTAEYEKRNFKDALRIIREYEQLNDYHTGTQKQQYDDALAEIERLKPIIAEQTKFDKIEKRTASMIDTIAIDVNQLSGNFIILQDKYMLVLADFQNLYVKNELINPESYSREVKVTNRYTILKRADANEFYYFMPDDLIAQIEHDDEIKRYNNMGNTTEYKTWKAKYLNLIQSAQLNVKACKAIIAKHTYRNRWGEKLYDSSTFTKQEKATFNQNLDSLNAKNEQIRQLESNRDLYLYYTDKATVEESAKSYQLSDFYNKTGRCY